MSLLLAILSVPLAMWAGRAVGRALRKAGRTTAADDEEREPGGARSRTEAPTTESHAKDDALDGFPCHLGDVILAHPGDEAWLAGALVFRERLPMAILFIAPDAGGGRAVYARPDPEPSLVWLTPLAKGALAIGKEPPSSIEHERERFERTRRLPFRVERIGTGAPDVGDSVLVAEYSAAAGDRLVVVVGEEGAHAWRGRKLDAGMYDVLPSGKATLDAE